MVPTTYSQRRQRQQRNQRQQCQQRNRRQQRKQRQQRRQRKQHEHWCWRLSLSLHPRLKLLIDKWLNRGWHRRYQREENALDDLAHVIHDHAQAMTEAFFVSANTAFAKGLDPIEALKPMTHEVIAPGPQFGLRPPADPYKINKQIIFTHIDRMQNINILRHIETDEWAMPYGF